MQPIHTLVEILQDRGQRRLPLERMYRHVCREDLLIEAYVKICRNDGSTTPGVDGQTVDGMSRTKIKEIVQTLKEGNWVWKPVRRVHIPKKSGGTRPLGIPSWGDRLVQQAIKIILEPYYEPQFSKYSFGFRPGLGCHHALHDVAGWQGTKWFIEGDISKCFDTIDHDVLMHILGEKLHDDRLLKLIRTMLTAGFMEEWKWGQSYSGTPQGGIASPLLSNVYLDQLDQFVERELVPRYNRGKYRKVNPEWNRVNHAIGDNRERLSGEEYQRLVRLRRTLPSRVTDDPDFRRLRYVRYADDFLLGFIGPKSEAEQIKAEIRDFLSSRLKLKLSEEKTLITHATEEKARFLGYEIAIRQSDDKVSPFRGGTRRCVNGMVGLFVPRNIVQVRLQRFIRGGKPAHFTPLIAQSDYHIVSYYQAIYRGLVNYYRMAHNLSSRLDRVRWVLEVSMVKTLANKHKCSCASLWREHKVSLPTEHGRVNAFQVRVERSDKPDLVAYFGGLSLRREKFAPLEDRVIEVFSGDNDLILRFRLSRCQLCGAKGVPLENHHVRRLADLLKSKQKGPLPRWKKLMISIRRKTITICQNCHKAIHDGTYDGPALP
jgi:group II intron reverse transcriptase/maturase